MPACYGSVDDFSVEAIYSLPYPFRVVGPMSVDDHRQVGIVFRSSEIVHVSKGSTTLSE